MLSCVREKLCLVQFWHPGEEHKLRRKEEKDGIKNWNQWKHKRKFLKNPGEYIKSVNGSPIQDDIVFWAEWEPESKLLKTIASPVREGPKYIYEPFYTKFRIKMLPLQNTDPFVFGSQFHYTICRQGKSPELRHLKQGSVILFGSCLHNQFVLDTVFVMGEEFIDHNEKNYREKLRSKISPVYEECVIKPIYQRKALGCLQKECVKSGISYRLYFGVNYKNRVNNMFSFFPCLPFKKAPNGFPRPIIKLNNKITTQKPKQGWKFLLESNETTLGDVKRYWGQVVKEVLDQGLYLGIFTELPRERDTIGS